MKLREMTNEQALEALADLIDPIAEICKDKEIISILQNKERNKMDAVKRLLRCHKTEVITVMAILDGVSPSEYKLNIMTLPLKVVEILNDPELVQVFTSQLPKTGQASSGAVSADAHGQV